MDMASNSFFEQRYRGAADMPGTLTESWVAGRLRLSAPVRDCAVSPAKAQNSSRYFGTSSHSAEAAGGELHR
jgi:hypothetical protein